MRILVAGQAKTGTSALWTAIRDTVPAGYRCEFEPRNYQGQHDKIVLKLLVGVCNFSAVLDFDKRILIVRDPRDTLVSRLMYAAYDARHVHRRPESARAWLDIVARKQADPRSISVREMFETLERLARGPYINVLLANYGMVSDWCADGWHVVRYERFVAGDWRGLEDYLGFRLRWNGRVWGYADRVTRRKQPGAWRHWFTEDDVRYWQPLFARYMERWDYGDDWKLAKRPKIARAHSTDYVRRLLRERGARL